MALLSPAQVYSIMQAAFGDLGPDVVRQMAATVIGESGGYDEETGQWYVNTDAHNQSGENSRGIGQINIAPGGNTDLSGMNLFDPQENAKAMRIVYDRQGPNAWSVYSSGDFKKYLDLFGGDAVPLAKQVAEPANVMAPRSETKQADPVPLIDPARIGPPDWSMISPLIRQGGGNSPLAPFMQGVPLVPRLGGM